jgi:formate dehydrogenase major subunit
MTNSISEVGFYDALFVIGSNATEAHPIIGNKMKRAVKRGAKLIVADPRMTELAATADIWLRLKPGTDAALINGLMNIIINQGWADDAFIEEHCEGYDSLLKVVKEYTPERVSGITGVPEDELLAAAETYALIPRAGIFYTLGITEHTTGTANVMNLANLAMVTGHVGVEHAGVNPLRGQNNVQGACDMGALPNVFSGYQSVSHVENRAAFEEEWKVELSDVAGLRIPEMLDGAYAGDVKAMYVMGEDPVLTDADANHVRKAMDNLEFLVVQDLFMTETAKYADVFLPAACYAEKEGTFTNTERRVQRVRKAVDPPGQCRPDWEIIHHGTQYLHAGGFPRGRGLMQGIEYQEPAELTDDEYPFLLTTGRRLMHYNVSTRKSNSLETLLPRELMEMNPADAARLELNMGDDARVTSRRGSITAGVDVTERVPEGVVFMSFHFVESPVNELTNSAYDPEAKTAEYKVCAVKIERAGS